MTVQFEACGAQRFRGTYFICDVDRVGVVRPDPALAAIGDPGDRGFTIDLHRLRAIEARSSNALTMMVYVLDRRAPPGSPIRPVGRVVQLLEVPDGSAAEIEICRHCAGLEDLTSVALVPVFLAGSSSRDIISLAGLGLMPEESTDLWWANEEQRVELIRRHRLVPVTTPEGTTP